MKNINLKVADITQEDVCAVVNAELIIKDIKEAKKYNYEYSYRIS